jgi:hypothetical protein
MITTVLKHVTPTEWHNQYAACPGAVSVNPQVWTEMDQNIYVHPTYGASAQSTSLIAYISSTDTTISVTDTTNFKRVGRLLIDNEEIEYTDLDATTFYDCTRGVGGTYPTAHDSGLPSATQLDLYIVYRRFPLPLATVTDTPEIKSVYHEQLELYAMYLAYMQTGEGEKAGAIYDKYQQTLKDIQWTTSKEDLTMIGVHDLETMGRPTLYGPRG